MPAVEGLGMPRVVLVVVYYRGDRSELSLPYRESLLDYVPVDHLVARGSSKGALVVVDGIWSDHLADQGFEVDSLLNGKVDLVEEIGCWIFVKIEE